MHGKGAGSSGWKSELRCEPNRELAGCSTRSVLEQAGQRTIRSGAGSRDVAWPDVTRKETASLQPRRSLRQAGDARRLDVTLSPAAVSIEVPQSLSCTVGELSHPAPALPFASALRYCVRYSIPWHPTRGPWECVLGSTHAATVLIAGRFVVVTHMSMNPVALYPNGPRRNADVFNGSHLNRLLKDPNCSKDAALASRCLRKHHFAA